MIELSLIEAGWKATSLGTSLPFSTLDSAVRKYQPKLVWLSVSVLNDPGPFSVKFDSFASEIDDRATVFVGGRATSMEVVAGMANVVHCDRIRNWLRIQSNSCNLKIDRTKVNLHEYRDKLERN